MNGKIEAHGVKGLESKPWRRTFRSLAALRRWVDENDAQIWGTRAVL